MLERENNLKVSKYEYLILFFIVVLGVLINFIPHFSYPYPLHLDEWTNMAYANQILKQGSIVHLVDPFGGGPPSFIQQTEVGYHVFLIIIQEITRLNWITIFRYMPSLIFAITIITTYFMARKLGFGLEAAFFVSLMPTGLGVLGPAFMVSVAAGLFFVPLSLYLVFRKRSWWSPILLALSIFYLLSSHAYTAIVIVIICMPYLVLNIKEDWKHSLWMGLALVGPFLAVLPFAWHLVAPFLADLTTPQEPSPYVAFPFLLKSLGYFTIAFCLIGVFILSLRRQKRTTGILLGFFLVLVVLNLFAYLHYGVSRFFDEGFLWVMILASIIAGAGLAAIRKFQLPSWITDRIKLPNWGIKHAGIFLCLILIGGTLGTVIPERQNAPYYHMIDKTDYETFVWIRNNLNNRDDKALLDPWKCTAFTAITGKKALGRLTTTLEPWQVDVYNFLKNGCSDSGFLINNHITLVYTTEAVNNPDLVEVREYVYLFNKP